MEHAFRSAKQSDCASSTADFSPREAYEARQSDHRFWGFTCLQAYVAWSRLILSDDRYRCLQAPMSGTREKGKEALPAQLWGPWRNIPTWLLPSPVYRFVFHSDNGVFSPKGGPLKCGEGEQGSRKVMEAVYCYHLGKALSQHQYDDADPEVWSGVIHQEAVCLLCNNFKKQ